MRIELVGSAGDNASAVEEDVGQRSSLLARAAGPDVLGPESESEAAEAPQDSGNHAVAPAEPKLAPAVSELKLIIYYPVPNEKYVKFFLRQEGKQLLLKTVGGAVVTKSNFPRALHSKRFEKPERPDQSICIVPVGFQHDFFGFLSFLEHRYGFLNKNLYLNELNRQNVDNLISKVKNCKDRGQVFIAKSMQGGSKLAGDNPQEKQKQIVYSVNSETRKFSLHFNDRRSGYFHQLTKENFAEAFAESDCELAANLEVYSANDFAALQSSAELHYEQLLVGEVKTKLQNQPETLVFSKPRASLYQALALALKLQFFADDSRNQDHYIVAMLQNVAGSKKVALEWLQTKSVTELAKFLEKRDPKMPTNIDQERYLLEKLGVEHFSLNQPDDDRPERIRLVVDDFYSYAVVLDRACIESALPRLQDRALCRDFVVTPAQGFTANLPLWWKNLRGYLAKQAVLDQSTAFCYEKHSTFFEVVLSALVLKAIVAKEKSAKDALHKLQAYFTTTQEDKTFGKKGPLRKELQYFYDSKQFTENDYARLRKLAAQLKDYVRWERNAGDNRPSEQLLINMLSSDKFCFIGKEQASYDATKLIAVFVRRDGGYGVVLPADMRLPKGDLISDRVAYSNQAETNSEKVNKAWAECFSTERRMFSSVRAMFHSAREAALSSAVVVPPEEKPDEEDGPSTPTEGPGSGSGSPSPAIVPAAKPAVKSTRISVKPTKEGETNLHETLAFLLVAQAKGKLGATKEQAERAQRILDRVFTEKLQGNKSAEIISNYTNLMLEKITKQLREHLEKTPKNQGELELAHALRIFNDIQPGFKLDPSVIEEPTAGQPYVLVLPGEFHQADLDEISSDCAEIASDAPAPESEDDESKSDESDESDEEDEAAAKPNDGAAGLSGAASGAKPQPAPDPKPSVEAFHELDAEQFVKALRVIKTKPVEEQKAIFSYKDSNGKEIKAQSVSVTVADKTDGEKIEEVAMASKMEVAYTERENITISCFKDENNKFVIKATGGQPKEKKEELIKQYVDLAASSLATMSEARGDKEFVFDLKGSDIPKGDDDTKKQLKAAIVDLCKNKKNVLGVRFWDGTAQRCSKIKVAAEQGVSADENTPPNAGVSGSLTRAPGLFGKGQLPVDQPGSDEGPPFAAASS